MPAHPFPRLLLAAVLACSSGNGAAAGEPLLSAPFTDHAVLQRGRPVPVWGQATPGDTVEVRLGDRHARAQADAQGRWRVQLAALPAGGPYVLDVRAGTRMQQLQDILVGDVWLCSGQSNMELQVHRALDSRSEIASADNDRLRLLQVAKQASPVPLTRFATPPRWQATTPDSVRDFSAACYFFGRELQASQDVPIGLIHASWGGTRIQAWLSEAALRRLGGHDAQLQVLALRGHDPAAANAGWGRLWQDWWQQQPGIAHDDTPWQDTGTSGWQDAAPSGRWIDPSRHAVVGMDWYRASARLTAAQASQAATLELGPVDELDLTWVNGTAVGSESAADTPRRYPLAAGTLHAGLNRIVVNVLNTHREGGIGGPAGRQVLVLADGTRVPLQHWQVRPVPAGVGTPPVAPWTATSGLMALHNAMIAPLAGYGLRGAAWYQGESNTFQAAQYGALLDAYRDDLRNDFGSGLPLLVVQLANFGTAPIHPGDSEWARLREAQRQTVANDPRSALAVAIDIGERGDIHPSNKQEVGRRLARAARHVAYGEAVPPSGPVPLRAYRQSGDVVVEFTDVAGALVAYGGTGPVGFELCGATQESCRYATARIVGSRVHLQASDAAAVTRVRHAWADSPVVTLYDSDGLPAGPFELPIE